MDSFMFVISDAMRVGQPGPCKKRNRRRTYHELHGDDVRAVRASSGNGGIVHCVRCLKPIFVPGDPEAGIIVQGIDVNMKGVPL
jgi:hypothetical protein